MVRTDKQISKTIPMNTQFYKRQRRLRRIRNAYVHSMRERIQKIIKEEPTKLKWWQKIWKFLTILIPAWRKPSPR